MEEETGHLTSDSWSVGLAWSIGSLTLPKRPLNWGINTQIAIRVLAANAASNAYTEYTRSSYIK
jgi:hypothetical protein